MPVQRERANPKKRRGPAPTGKGAPVVVRLQPDALEWLDAERARRDPVPSRPEMIRILLELAKRQCLFDQVD